MKGWGRHFAAGAATWTMAFAASANVFINELHYDNVGADTDEKVEVAAPAGTNLSGWKIVLYNGSGGASYSTVNLSGTVANQCSGWGTVAVAVAGIQNGNPDGVALVNASGAVVQFLSYGGTFAATNGPASGMTSTAIPQSENASTPVGHSLRLTGSGNAYSNFTWAAPAASSFGACNPGQTFTGSGGGGGGNVLANGVPVTGLSANTGTMLAYTLAVPAGASNLAIAISGGTGDADLYVKFGSAPTTSSYDCRPYLSGNAENCPVPAPATGTYHIGVRAYTSFSGVSLVASYSTGGSDAAPTLVSSTPANGATGVGVGSNISLTFSEAVTVSSGWFGIACASTGTHAAVVSGGPVTFTLNPSVDFGPLETCTLTITASKVLDQDGTPTPMAANATRSFTTMAAPSGYYGSVVTTSASALRASLHNVIDDHTKIPYTASSTDTWDVLAAADQDPMNSSRVLDVYKNQSLAKQSGGNNYYNREHTWPNSLGFGNDGSTNYPYTDLHMLMVTDIGYNSTRGNKPYDNCSSGCTELPTVATNGAGGGSGAYPGNSNWSNSSVFEVWSKFKGNVARAMFYMDVRYEGGTHGVSGASEPDLRLTNDLSQVVNTGGNASVAYMGKLSTLLQWHQADPPDAAEQLRNEVVFSYQGNRNPFIDHPEWVACIYQNVCN